MLSNWPARPCHVGSYAGCQEVPIPDFLHRVSVFPASPFEDQSGQELNGLQDPIKPWVLLVVVC